ncbi:hypothetical protein HDU87_001754 [Geranomyces variabilis]|uniref:CCAAT-binding factor domain-containing protein n=1 Tax=Geranomyces variabilis TaxID=109894 RepID=A0AAD5TRW4_9FUNG|nr:hypothetical protein HDU87_001754 [Geranomyces variabilis]
MKGSKSDAKGQRANNDQERRGKTQAASQKGGNRSPAPAKNNKPAAAALTPTSNPVAKTQSAREKRKGYGGGKAAITAKPVAVESSAASSSRRDVLLREILLLGGEADDLDLIDEALSGSEAEDETPARTKKSTKPTKAAPSLKTDDDVDEGALLLDLQKFMTADLKIDPAKSQIIEVDDAEGEDEEWEDDQASEDDEEDDDEDSDEAPALVDEGADPVNEGFAPEVLQAVMNMASDDEDFDGVDDNDELAETSAKYGKEDATEVRNMVSQMLQGQKVDDKLSRRLLCEPLSQWHTVVLPPVSPPTRELDEAYISSQYLHAQTLYQGEVDKYERSKSMSSADTNFISTVLKSGTVTDKVSALTLLVQESPLHTLAHLRDQLVNGMARKKARREAVMAIDSVKDLLLSTLLPDRKLKYFRDQPLQSPDVKPIHLVSWYFEDGLKKTYYEFIKLLEELARDPLLHVKNKMIQYIFDLLAAKPEQEQNLLALLTNKLGDQDRKLASKSAHLLSRLLVQHPVMKLVVIKEVERLLFRPNISDRARYYAVTFLNQIVFSHKEQDAAAANRLIEVYFAVFDGLGKRKAEAESVEVIVKKDRWRDKKKGGKKGGNAKSKAGKPAFVPAADAQDPMGEVDGIDAKMMAALLTGVNRAFPFAKIDDNVFDSHMATLFRVTHVGTFNTSIQALSLILQVQSSRQSVSDRFYRALYDTLVDPRLYSASKQAMYLNLLFRAIKADTSSTRVRAFIKRLVQICGVANVPFACASLFLIGEIAKGRPEIWTMVNLPEAGDDDDVEKFVDVLDEEDKLALAATRPDNKDRMEEDDATPTAGTESTKYDGRKRDPLYCHADSSCLWELSQFAWHFHPTVSLYTKTLLSGQSILPPPNTKNYDPLQNHTLQRFLDRFVFKNPKKVESAYKGTSLMQPRVAGLNAGPKDEDRLVSAARKRGVIVQNEDVGTVALDDVPVHLRAQKWVEEDGKLAGVPVDEEFFYRFFKTKHQTDAAAGKLRAKRKSARTTDDVDDVDGPAGDVDALDADSADEDDEELGEDEVWDAMRRSAGFAAEGDDDDDLMADDGEDLSDDDEDLDLDGHASDASGVSSAADSDGEEVDMEDVFRKMDGVGAGASDDEDDDAMAKWAAGASDDNEAAAAGASDEDSQGWEDEVAGGAGFDDEDDELDGSDGEQGFAKWMTLDEEEDLSASDASEDEDDNDKAKDKKKKKKPSRMAVKAQALGYKGAFFDTKSGISGLGAFASAEDFEAMLASEEPEGHDADEEEERRPRRKPTGGSGPRQKGSGASGGKGAQQGGPKRKRSVSRGGPAGKKSKKR